MIIRAIHTDTVRDPAQFASLLNAVSAGRRDRVLSFHREEDRWLSLCAGLSLDACLRTVGLREADEPIERNEHGKPRLAEHPEYHFSLSHSGEWAICALDTAPVGVDVERCAPVRAGEIAKRFFAPQETAYLNALPSEQRERYFYRLWTAKESLLKAMGTGIAGGADVLVGNGDVLAPPSPWKLREYAWEGYALTACGTGEFPDSVVISFCDSVPLR